MSRKSRKSPTVDLRLDADKASNALSTVGETINAITLLYRDYLYAQESRKGLDLRLVAYLRHALGWRNDLPKKEREAIATDAAKIAKNPNGTQFGAMVNANIAGRVCFDTVEAHALKAMVKLSEGLPVWQVWGKDVRGFGAKSLAVIVAEAGDLSNYATIAKLWKRMGLAVMDGRKQGNVAKNLSRDARKAAFIAHGYSPVRRSQMWNIGDALIKAQVRKVKDADGQDTGERIALGVYGEAYLYRKLRTQKTHPEWWCDKDGNPMLDEKSGRSTSDHGNKDAQRYMEKRLLRDLWKAWRRTTFRMAEKPVRPVSDVDNLRDAATFASGALSA